MRRLRPALAIAAALTLTAAAAPALGASSTTPATGTAQSALQILDLRVAGHTVQAGGIAAVARNTPSHLAQLVITPAALDGTAVGQQTVTPSSAPATVPSSPQSTSIPQVLSLTGPTFDVTAQDSATEVLTSAALKAIGSVTLTPAGLAALPVNLQAVTLNNVAKVTSSQSQAEKQIVIGDLSLPSVNQLFSALGIDLNALLDQLTQGNLSKLGGLVDASLSTLNSAVDTAQSALATATGKTAPDTLSAATGALAPAQAAVTTATSNLSAAQAALTAANSAWSSALSAALALPVVGGVLSGAGITASTTPQQYLSLVAGNSALSVQSLVDAANSVVNAQAAVDAANTALTAANNVVTLVNNLIDALQALVNGVAGAVTGNTDPLAALGNITVQTKAVAASTSPTPVAEASLGSLQILGTSTPVSQLTSALNGVTQTLSSVLKSVAGVAFTPPSIALGTGHTSTSKVGETRKATASITGLTITLPSIALPAALSTVTNAISGAVGISNGTVSVLGGSVGVATLSETAEYTPATTTTTSTPGTPSGSGTPSGPSLASTGLSRTIPVAAALLIVTSLAVIRRRRLARDL